MITNNTYIDGITHRRMRQSLIESFNHIHILDLHGSVKKKETSPDGSKDENVFDIQQGVAIGVFVKTGPNANPSVVSKFDLWGTRETKYACLAETSIATTPWTLLQAEPEQYFFVSAPSPKQETLQNHLRINVAFALHCEGVMTSRDQFAIAMDKLTLSARLEEMRDPKLLAADIRNKYQIPDTRDWRLDKARTLLVEDKDWEQDIVQILHVPFDLRWTHHSQAVMDWPRLGVLTNLRFENLAILTTRQTKDDFGALVTKIIARHKAASRYDKTFLFPLYIYPETGTSDKRQRAFKEGSQWPPGPSGRRPNFAPDSLEMLTQRLGLQFKPDGKGDLQSTLGPEDLLPYFYAVLYSPTYRQRYAEFLKIDFPRIPLTSHKKLFRALVEKGAELVSLHLLESPKVNEFITRFPESGDNAVEKVTYDEKKKCVHINKTQYFEGVPKNVWEFYIGGYQVCEKWLKDRKGRELSADDIAHYQKVVVALNETIRLMREIDEVIPAWPLP